MIKKFRKLLCHILGHRSICLYSELNKDEYGRGSSMTTAWMCERCNHTSIEGWDM